MSAFLDRPLTHSMATERHSLEGGVHGRSSLSPVHTTPEEFKNGGLFGFISAVIDCWQSVFLPKFQQGLWGEML